jgi:DNA replication protein DnaC
VSFLGERFEVDFFEILHGKSPPLGISWIAQALGHKACSEGLRVLFVRQPMLIHAMLTAKATGGLPGLLKRLAKVNVLIID